MAAADVLYVLREANALHEGCGKWIANLTLVQCDMREIDAQQ